MIVMKRNLQKKYLSLFQDAIQFLKIKNTEKAPKPCGYWVFENK